jgi:thiamine biosynthesis protein ThiC
MNTYVILRRKGWATPNDAEAAGARSKAEGDQMSDDIRWIRSYVLAEADGSIGTVCIYQASSEQALREHTARADLQLDEIVEVADTVIVRPDPVGATA